MSAATGRLPALTKPFPLAEEQVAAYRRDGHVLLRGVASREEIAAFRPAIAEAVEALARRHRPQGRFDDYGRLFTQVTNHWRLSETARGFVFARRSADIAARLMGVPAVRLYHDQALFKERGARPRPGTRTTTTGRSTPITR